MAGKVKAICEEKIVPVIENMGYEVIEVAYAKQADGMNLTFYIDADSPITIDDCEKVTKVIDPLLDEINPTEDKPYILNVSSPGLDRPLKSERDFLRNIENEVDVTLFSKLDGKKVYSGVLKSFDQNSVTIFDGKENRSFERKLIAHIVPVIKF